ncbi:MAG: DnaA regulatory inactivator Hda [Lysobacteraceae bacterium]
MNHPQLPLSLRFPPDQRFATFVGASAEVALLSAIAAGERDDWCVINGAPGCGKTHLLLAACAAADAAGRRSVYLPLRHLAGQVDAVIGAQEQADLIAIDDLDGIAPEGDPEAGRADQIALFDLHNRVRAAGGVILYAARQTPHALPLALPDLRSRLQQCTLLSLRPLDDDGRRELLRRRADNRGLQLDDAVIEYLLRRFDRDLSSLTALLERLDQASLATQRRITVPFLRQFLISGF